MAKAASIPLSDWAFGYVNFWLLVDGNNIAARGRFAMPDLMTSTGMLTGAIYGFLKSCSWARNHLEIPLNRTVVVWDGGWAAWRKALYPEYKAKRKDRDPKKEAEHQSYLVQLDGIREILRNVNCRQVKVLGVEADDILGLLTGLNEKNGDHTFIYSGDGDMHQLASERTHIFDPTKDQMSIADLLNKWKVADIEDILLKKAIWGDSSDGIYGVPKLGDKRSSIVTAYLRATDDNRVEIKDGALPVPAKDGKHVSRALDHQDIIERNLKLMRLPRSVSEWLYPIETASKAITQFLHLGEVDRMAFMEAIDRFELESINLVRW